MQAQGTHYWDYALRDAGEKDIGNVCRECKRPFTTLGEQIVERRGARVALRYHRACFSWEADPRSQENGTFHKGKWARSTVFSDQAPEQRFPKMRTATHFG